MPDASWLGREAASRGIAERERGGGSQWGRSSAAGRWGLFGVGGSPPGAGPRRPGHASEVRARLGRGGRVGSVPKGRGPRGYLLGPGGGEFNVFFADFVLYLLVRALRWRGGRSHIPSRLYGPGAHPVSRLGWHTTHGSIGLLIARAAPSFVGDGFGRAPLAPVGGPPGGTQWPKKCGFLGRPDSDGPSVGPETQWSRRAVGA